MFNKGKCGQALKLPCFPHLHLKAGVKATLWLGHLGLVLQQQVLAQLRQLPRVLRLQRRDLLILLLTQPRLEHTDSQIHRLVVQIQESSRASQIRVGGPLNISGPCHTGSKFHMVLLQICAWPAAQRSLHPSSHFWDWDKQDGHLTIDY